MKFDLKWVHVARYGLTLELDGVLWLRTTSEPHLTPNMLLKGPKTRTNLIKGFHNQLLVPPASIMVQEETPNEEEEHGAVEDEPPQNETITECEKDRPGLSRAVMIACASNFFSTVASMLVILTSVCGWDSLMD